MQVLDVSFNHLLAENHCYCRIFLQEDCNILHFLLGSSQNRPGLSVLHFNRVPAFICAVARRWLGIVVQHFFDAVVHLLTQ